MCMPLENPAYLLLLHSIFTFTKLGILVVMIFACDDLFLIPATTSTQADSTLLSDWRSFVRSFLNPQNELSLVHYFQQMKGVQFIVHKYI